MGWRACYWRFTPTPIWTILNGVSTRKAWVTMASKTSAAEGQPVIDMAELGARLARRKAELGLADPPCNAGKRRTASKRALLKAIEVAGGKW